MEPPYQAAGNASTGRKGGAGNEFWDKFVEKLISLCNDNGYIAMIHPSTWRKPEHKIWNKITKYYIKYLEIHNKKDAQKTLAY